MNTTKAMELIANGATIEGFGINSYLVHPSFKKGKRKIGSIIYWAIWFQCQTENIVFPKAD